MSLMHGARTDHARVFVHGKHRRPVNIVPKMLRTEKISMLSSKFETRFRQHAERKIEWLTTAELVSYHLSRGQGPRGNLLGPFS